MISLSSVSVTLFNALCNDCWYAVDVPFIHRLDKVNSLVFTELPVNTTEFMINPLLRSLDYDLPKITIDVQHALFMARVFWVVHTLLYPWLNREWLPPPLLLPAEVYKVSILSICSYTDLVWRYCCRLYFMSLSAYSSNHPISGYTYIPGMYARAIFSWYLVAKPCQISETVHQQVKAVICIRSIHEY